MIKILKRHAYKSPRQPIDWSYNPVPRSESQDLIRYNCYRDKFTFTLSIVKPKFQIRKNYFSLKSKGQLSVEFIPYDLNSDSDKKIPLYDESYQFHLNTTNIYNILNESSVKLENGKENSADYYELLVNEYPYGWEWRINKGGIPENEKKIIFTRGESYWAKDYIKNAIPYVFGWNAMSNPKYCAMNLDNEQNIR